MKGQRSYFEPADFQSEWPYQFLAGAVTLLLVFIEQGLAQWPVFFGASPILSLIFMYYIMVYKPNLMPIGTIFLTCIIADILFSDILGGRAAAFMLLSYVVQARIFRLRQCEFTELWLDFALSCIAVLLFQLIIFSAVNFTVPSLSPVLFQAGVTLILFPPGYVLIYSIYHLLEKLRLVA